jgi:hypothetical protein
MDESGPGKIPDFFSNFLSGALNSLSPRSVSFTVPVEREKSINLFFGLLNFPGKNIKMF